MDSVTAGSFPYYLTWSLPTLEDLIPGEDFQMEHALPLIGSPLLVCFYFYVILYPSLFPFLSNPTKHFWIIGPSINFYITMANVAGWGGLLTLTLDSLSSPNWNISYLSPCFTYRTDFLEPVMLRGVCFLHKIRGLGLGVSE